MLFVSDALIGELAILLFLLLVVLRPLFKKPKQLDSFAVIAAFAFCLAILQLFVFGATLLLLIIVGVSFLVLLTNIRALQRFASKLYIDQYSIPFRVASYIELVFIVICLVLSILFQPEPIQKNLRDTQVYFGSFTRGFSEKTDLFQPINLVLTEYSIENIVEHATDVDPIFSKVEQPLVVFLSDIRTSVEDSKIRLSRAAELGVNIVAGDFYSEDLPKTGTSLDSAIFSSPLLKSMTQHFLPPLDSVAKKAFLHQKELELDVLLGLAGERSTSVVIVAEGIAKEAALNAQRKYPSFVVSVFDATEDETLNEYYERGIADLAFTSPLDALFASFGGFSGYKDYKEFRAVAQNEDPALLFAELLLQHVQDISKGGI